MFGAIKKRFMKMKQVLVSAVTGKDANATISNPMARKILPYVSMFEQIKDQRGIDLTDYDSFDDFIYAYFSKLDAEGLEVMRRSVNTFMRDAAEAELVRRDGRVAMCVDGYSAGTVQSFATNT